MAKKKETEGVSPMVKAVFLVVACLLVMLAIMWVGK